MEKQRTLDGRIVPVGPHRDDLVECEDGTIMRRGDIEFTDCRGRAYSDEDERDEANNDIVAEILDAEYKCCEEYCESDDYGDGYAYVVCEDTCRWKDRFEEWLDANYTRDYRGRDYPVLGDPELSMIVNGMLERADEYDLEAKYQSNEYACYYGDGCAVDSFEVGEYEHQIDINGRDEFEVLHEEGALEGCLASYNGDLYLHCNDRYDRESGRRVREGYVSKGSYPHIMAYAAGMGRWHYVISDESMERLLCEAIVDFCKSVDGN